MFKRALFVLLVLSFGSIAHAKAVKPIDWVKFSEEARPGIRAVTTAARIQTSIDVYKAAHRCSVRENFPNQLPEKLTRALLNKNRNEMDSGDHKCHMGVVPGSRYAVWYAEECFLLDPTRPQEALVLQDNNHWPNDIQRARIEILGPGKIRFLGGETITNGRLWMKREAATLEISDFDLESGVRTAHSCWDNKWGISGHNIKDFDGDGISEVIVTTEFGYQGAWWPWIYRWDGSRWTDVSEMYPDYYKKKVLPEYFRLKVLWKGKPVEQWEEERAQYLDILIKHAKEMANGKTIAP